MLGMTTLTLSIRTCWVYSAEHVHQMSTTCCHVYINKCKKEPGWPQIENVRIGMPKVVVQLWGKLNKILNLEDRVNVIYLRHV